MEATFIIRPMSSDRGGENKCPCPIRLARNWSRSLRRFLKAPHCSSDLEFNLTENEVIKTGVLLSMPSFMPCTVNLP